jgi:hypothetical protein
MLFTCSPPPGAERRTTSSGAATARPTWGIGIRYEPVCLSPMPPPAARRTNAAGKQTKSCNRFGCSYKSTFPGNVGRHYTFSCELRNEAERHYADQLTTCYLCETQPKYSRLDVLRRHIRSKHYEPDLKPKIKGLQKKRNSAGSSAYIDSRNFYGSY